MLSASMVLEAATSVPGDCRLYEENAGLVAWRGRALACEWWRLPLVSPYLCWRGRKLTPRERSPPPHRPIERSSRGGAPRPPRPPRWVPRNPPSPRGNPVVPLFSRRQWRRWRRRRWWWRWRRRHPPETRARAYRGSLRQPVMLAGTAAGTAVLWRRPWIHKSRLDCDGHHASNWRWRWWGFRQHGQHQRRQRRALKRRRRRRRKRRRRRRRRLLRPSSPSASASVTPPPPPPHPPERRTPRLLWRGDPAARDSRAGGSDGAADVAIGQPSLLGDGIRCKHAPPMAYRTSLILTLRRSTDFRVARRGRCGGLHLAGSSSGDSLCYGTRYNPRDVPRGFHRRARGGATAMTLLPGDVAGTWGGGGGGCGAAPAAHRHRGT